MNIKNYTTTVPAEKSVQNIEKLLIDAGAIGINKTIDPNTKTVDGIIFQLMIDMKPVFFKMEVTEANIHSINRIIAKGKRMNATQTANSLAQAKRIAWKLLYEEIHIQLTRVHLQQAKMIKIFLPHVCNPYTGQTLYERLQLDNFKLLTEGNNAE